MKDYQINNGWKHLKFHKKLKTTDLRSWVNTIWGNCVCTKQQSCKIYKAKTNRTERKNRQIHMVGDFNSLLSPIDKTTGQKISKDIELNSTISQWDLIDIYRTLHPIATEYTLFWSVCRTYTKIDHRLGQKTSLNKFKRMETIRSILSKHNWVVSK